MRRAARTDGPQEAIVTALRRCGVKVAVTSGCGTPGFPDLVCAARCQSGRSVTWLVECKNGSLPKSQRGLTPDQVAFHESWPGELFVVERAEDVPALVVRVCGGG